MPKHYRDASTGKYTTAADAAQRPAETVAETAPTRQQHLWHPEGGAWCSADVAHDPEVAGVRPRVPVCAVCHIKAMHYRADLQHAAEAQLAHMTEARDNARAEVERLEGQVEAVRAVMEDESHLDGWVGNYIRASALRRALDGGAES